MPAPHPSLISILQGDPQSDIIRVTTAVSLSADEHGVAPLISEAAREDAVDGDHDALVFLAAQSLENAVEVGSKLLALSKVLDTADALGIDIAIFKGLSIGCRWYARPELRPAVDIDLFIDPGQIERLGELVEALGGNPDQRTTVELMVAERRVFEYALSVDAVLIDLHVDPMNLVVPSRQRNLMWQRTEMLEIPRGRAVRTLDLELSMIQALLHLFRDNFADLLHLHDVALMIDHDPDWAFIADYAETEGWTDLIRFSLGFVCDTFQRPSPLPRDITLVNRLLIAALWPDRLRLRGIDSELQAFRRPLLASFLIRGRRQDVAKAMAHKLLPPRYVIDDRFPGCNCPYPVALIRWRLSQRSRFKKGRIRSIPKAQFDNRPRPAAETAMAHETV